VPFPAASITAFIENLIERLLKIFPGGVRIKWEYLITELIYRKFSRPLAKFLASFDVSPTSITLIATFIGIFAGYLITVGKFYESIIVIFLSQILDCADGDLARISGRVTARGAYLDRMFDRFVDAALIIGIIAINPEEYWLLGILAIVGSFGVSISRAMAEAEGVECKVGVGGRDTRLLIIMFGLLLNQLYAMLVILIFLGFLTTAHRILHSIKQMDKE
jgi:CDP-diacylglycerol--glycerol-3-phosphate 3-phosphatidyltransferase